MWVLWRIDLDQNYSVFQLFDSYESEKANKALSLMNTRNMDGYRYELEWYNI